MAASSRPSISQRNITAIIRVAQNLADARVINIERIPFAAARISFGLHQNRVGRQSFHLRIFVFQKIAGIERDAQPRRINRLNDAPHARRATPQNPSDFPNPKPRRIFRRDSNIVPANQSPSRMLLLHRDRAAALRFRDWPSVRQTNRSCPNARY